MASTMQMSRCSARLTSAQRSGQRPSPVSVRRQAPLQPAVIARASHPAGNRSASAISLEDKEFLRKCSLGSQEGMLAKDMSAERSVPSLEDFIKLQRQLQETQDQLKAQKLECQCLRMDLGAASNVNAALRHTNFNLEQDLRDERRLRVQLRLRIEKLRATSPRAKTDISTDPGLERAAMKIVKSAELQLMESELVALRHEVTMLRSEAIQRADEYLSKATWQQAVTLP